MVKQNELRLGNWFYDQVTESYCYISNISHEGWVRIFIPNCDGAKDGSNTLTLEGLDPISLTEEILLKCGAINLGVYSNKIVLHNSPPGDMDGATQYEIGDISIFNINDSWHYEIYRYSDDYGLYHITKEFKTLHILQNLHFFFKGEELEVKL